MILNAKDVKQFAHKQITYSQVFFFSDVHFIFLAWTLFSANPLLLHPKALHMNVSWFQEVMFMASLNTLSNKPESTRIDWISVREIYYAIILAFPVYQSVLLELFNTAKFWKALLLSLSLFSNLYST